MKKVVSPSEVAHLWANQLQSEATNRGRSFYFERQAIYSYGSHFLYSETPHKRTRRKHCTIYFALLFKYNGKAYSYRLECVFTPR